MLILDEFHTTASFGIVDIIKQCVDLNVTCCPCHQNLKDLDQGTYSLLDAVQGNSALHVMFSADQHGKKFLQDSGGDRVRWLRSETRQVNENADGTLSISWSFGRQQSFQPQVSNDDVEFLKATSELGVVQAHPNKGLSQFDGPTFLQFLHVTSPGAYERMKKLPWPAVTPETMLGGGDYEPPTKEVLAPLMPQPNSPDSRVRKRIRKRLPAPVSPSLFGDLLNRAAEKLP